MTKKPKSGEFKDRLYELLTEKGWGPTEMASSLSSALVIVLSSFHDRIAEEALEILKEAYLKDRATLKAKMEKTND